jgi:hypothetical protein
VDIGASDERFEDMVIVAPGDGHCCDLDHYTRWRSFRFGDQSQNL